MSDAIRCVVVDDEAMGRANLRAALAAHPGWRILRECAGAAAARETLAKEPVDVVFLDIQMPGESGLRFAATLGEMAEPPIVIFVTAFERYALTAFDVHALDYLLKPFDDERFAKAISRARALLELQRREAYASALRQFAQEAEDARAGRGQPYLSRLTVRSVGRLECVNLADVLCLSASGNYVELRLATRRLLHRVALTQLERRLDPATFVRVHRGAIVRRDQIVRLEADGEESWRLHLAGGDWVPVSARYVGAVRAALEAVR